jgi:hypothetical protein
MHLSGFNLVDKARRAWRHRRRLDPSLPALVAGTGEIASFCTGSLAVTLTTADGERHVFIARPVADWRLRPATPSEAGKLGHITDAAKTAPSLKGEVASAIDFILSRLAILEARGREAARPSARGNGADHDADHHQHHQHVGPGNDSSVPIAAE